MPTMSELITGPEPPSKFSQGVAKALLPASKAYEGAMNPPARPEDEEESGLPFVNPFGGDTWKEITGLIVPGSWHEELGEVASGKRGFDWYEPPLMAAEWLLPVVGAPLAKGVKRTMTMAKQLRKGK